MKITEEILPLYQIAYIRKMGVYGEGNKEVMERLKRWAEEKDLFTDKTTILGIARDNPEITRAEECRYDTCLVLPEGYTSEEENIRKGSVEGGKYVIFEIDHTSKGVKEAWETIFQEIGRRGHKLDIDRPILERYRAEMIKEHKCELCVPVK